MDEGLPASTPLSHTPTSSRVALWCKRIICIGLSALGIAVIVNLSGELIQQVRSLAADWSGARDADPVGYIGISSEQPEWKPPSCIREEDGRILLWAGSGVKGQRGWFDVTGIDLDEFHLRQFRYAFGRDKVKTIDYPIVQTPEADIARRIYPEREVIGVQYQGIARAYPMTVMEKVEVVNDTFGNRPLAVTYCPLIHVAAVYERTLDGRPISLGSSGYCYKDAFVLYDRGTDSLWYPRPEGLTAICGPLAGKVLPRLEQPKPVAWSTWRRKCPRTEVVVGGDRSHGIPLPPADEWAERSL